MKSRLMSYRSVLILTLALVLFIGGACSRVAKEFPSFTVREDIVDDQLKAATEAYTLANEAKTRGDQMGFAKKGIFYARRCADLAPEKAACYFYQALNTGLFYEAKIFGYPKAMVRIAKAAHKVNELEPSYEHGGGYRILGKLYLEAPSFNIGSDEVTRDLDKSQLYLEEAVKTDPNYPENHLFLAETLIEQEDWTRAHQHLEKAEVLIRETDYPASDMKYWKELTRKMKKTLKKKSRGPSYRK
jgi:tetratricopeptide (TPR) repeat protein